MGTRRDLEHNYELCDGDDYFAEIKRQILLLTADDESIEHHSHSNEYRRRTGYRAYVHPGGWGRYEQGNNYPMLSQQIHSPLTGSGTGVFIPQNVPSRRRFNSGAMNRSHGRRRG